MTPSVQLEFPEPAKAKRKLTQTEMVECVMSDGQWRTFAMIQDALWQRYGVFASEAGISARLRDLRKRGYTVDSRPVAKGRKLYEYRVTK